MLIPAISKDRKWLALPVAVAYGVKLKKWVESTAEKVLQNTKMNVPFLAKANLGDKVKGF